MPGIFQLNIRQGDSQQFPFAFNNPLPNSPTSPGAPIDLTGALVKLVLKTSQNVVLTVSSIAGENTNGSSVQIPNPQTGQIIVQLSTADSQSLSPGTGMFELRVGFPNGTLTTYLIGAVVVAAELAQWTT